MANLPPGNRTVSYANEDSIYTKARADAPENDPEREQIIADLKAQMNGQTVGGVDGGGYAQVDLRPSWYKRFLSKNDYDISGPPTTSVGADIAGAIGSAATEGAQQNVNQLARMPGARADQVARLQAKANSRGMLTAGLGALLNKKSNDFDTQQKRATVDSSTLNKRVKTGASINERLGYLNFDKTTKRNEELAQQKAIEEAKKIAAADKNSPESRRSQIASVASGVVGPDTATETSKEELEKWRPAFQQTQAQENKTAEFDYEQSQLEGRKLSEEERAELRRVEGEKRDQEMTRRQSFVPGHKWANDVPPSPDVVKAAREFTAREHEIITAADEMKQIQDRLTQIGNEAGRAGITSPAAIGQYTDKYLGADETKNLLAKAQLLQQKMVTALRAQDNLGVLQQFEKAMEDAINPTAGSIGSYFRGAAPWDALISYERDYGTQAKKEKFGLFPENDPDRPNDDPLQRPSSEKVQRFERPVAQRPHSAAGPRGSAPAPLGVSAPSEFGVQPGDSLGGAQPVPPIPADARKPGTPSPVNGPQGDKPMAGMWIVNMPSGPTKPRALTESQYKMLQQKFPGQVKQVQ